MRSKVIVILAVVCLVAVGVYAALLNEGQPLPERYIQHEKAQHIEDLSAEDQAAASSTSTDPETFASHLPAISIDTGGQEIPGGPIYDENGKYLADENSVMIPSLAPDGSETIAANVKVFDNGQGANRLSNQADLESDCRIRIRGNSSRRYDKKNYLLTLVKEDGTDNDQELLGMDKCETWVLHGPGIDKSLIRNYLAYSIAGQYMDKFVPEIRFFELFIDGQYKGLYAAVESIKVEEGRLQVNPTDENTVATSYVVSIDEKSQSATTLSTFLNYTLRVGTYLDVVYPNEELLTEERREWINNDISAWEKSLFSYDYDTSDYGYWTTLDVSSFVDMYILNEFAINDDFGAYSTYLYKDLRGKVTLGPPWDYDNTFDNYQLETPVDEFYIVERAWYYMLFKDEEFCERTISRYRSLRQGVLSEDYLNTFIDETIDYLDVAIDRNWVVWGYTFQEDNHLKPEERQPASFEEAISNLKSFIHDRGAWLDQYIENLRQYSHESAVKKFNH